MCLLVAKNYLVFSQNRVSVTWENYLFSYPDSVKSYVVSSDILQQNTLTLLVIRSTLRVKYLSLDFINITASEQYILCICNDVIYTGGGLRMPTLESVLGIW